MISSFSEPIPVTSTTYQTTSSGNLISTRARIYGATAIILHGRNVIDPGVILLGDLRRSLLGSSASAGGGKSESDGQMAIVMGRYCRIGEDSVIRPPGKMTKGYVAEMIVWSSLVDVIPRRVFNYYKLSISDCVDIGERCVVEALSIGRGVTIGDDCIIVSTHITLIHLPILISLHFSCSLDCPLIRGNSQSYETTQQSTQVPSYHR
jgi:dynactin-5